MKPGYEPLIERFRGEVENLAALRNRILRAWKLANDRSEDQDIHLDAVALNLHGFYSGIEGLFVQVAQKIDDDLPQGEQWHRALLERIQEEKEYRPGVVGYEHGEFLGELLRFRHLVRNIYAFNLVPERIEPLVKGVDKNWESLKAELSAFAKFLETTAAAEQENDSKS